MAWSRGSAYSLLPNSPSFASSADFAPRSNHGPMSRQRWTRLYLMLSALALVVMSSVALVPHEHLPEQVQQAIGQGWEAYESAKQGVATSWRWTDTGADDAEVEMPEDEAEPGLWDGAVETAVEGGDLDHAVLLPVETGSADEAISTSDGAVSLTVAEPTTVHEEVVCSDEVRSMLGEASFWTVAGASPLLPPPILHWILTSSRCCSHLPAELRNPPSQPSSLRPPRRLPLPNRLLRTPHFQRRLPRIRRDSDSDHPPIAHCRD